MCSFSKQLKRKEVVHWIFYCESKCQSLPSTIPLILFTWLFKHLEAHGMTEECRGSLLPRAKQILRKKSNISSLNDFNSWSISLWCYCSSNPGYCTRRLFNISPSEKLRYGTFPKATICLHALPSFLHFIPLPEYIESAEKGCILVKERLKAEKKRKHNTQTESVQHVLRLVEILNPLEAVIQAKEIS